MAENTYHLCVAINGAMQFNKSNKIKNFIFERLGEQSCEFKRKIFLLDDQGTPRPCQILIVEGIIKKILLKITFILMPFIF